MSTVNVLISKNKCTVNEEGQIALNPLSRFEFRTYPINYEEPILWVDEDTYLGLLLKVYQFSEDLTNVEYFDSQLFIEFLRTRGK